MPLQHQHEATLLRGVAAGDRGAFEELYFSYQKRLFGYLYRVLGESGVAEELVNDVMVEVWKSAGRFRGDSKPATWIFGIAHHRLLNHLRRRRGS
ncbi:MAG: sigma-70 family RNA polymerase sigma factor [Bryobacterales bacterium]|nr:sigma-70 family RNA polymerase sigma factor [Bryobacterales bacterium]